MWDIIDRKDEKTDTVKNRKEKRSKAEILFLPVHFFQKMDMVFNILGR